MLNLLIALFTGAASALAFEPIGLWLLMPVAFAVLLWLLWRAETLWRALLTGWLFGVGQFVVGLNWIATAFSFQAAMPAWLGWIAVILLSLYLAVYPALAAGLAWRIGKDNEVSMVLALAGGWAITEWLRAGIFTGFAWNPVGVTLVDTPLIDFSVIVGTYGLSALTVLLGGALYLIVRRTLARQWPKSGSVVGLAVASPAILFLLFVALALLVPFGPDFREAPNRPIRVVQPNIGQHEKWRPGFADIAANRLESLSQAPGGERPRLLFWPEAAVTEPLQDERGGPAAAFARFERSRAAQSIGAREFLLTGGIGIESADGETISGATNSIFLLTPSAEIAGRYDKAHLVPYGEYLPMRSLLEPLGLSRLVPGSLDFTAGPGARTIDIPGWGKVGLQVCYEIIFSGEVVEDDKRPDFIFNPSNDAWFGYWGPPQHLAQARLRAAEEGLPVIRSTPTGISAVINAHGEVLESIGWREAGVIDTRLPLPSIEPTFFARFGNLIPLLLSALLLAGAIALAWGGRYRRT